jgi:hypothetical protein
MKTRESRYVIVTNIAYRLTQQALPKYSHAKKVRTILSCRNWRRVCC